MRRRHLPTRLIAALTACALLGALVPAGAQAAPELLHWYKADGDASDAVAGPNASGGTLNNTAAFGPGKSGEGFVFSGSFDYVTVPSNASFYPSGSVALDAWVRIITSAPLGPFVPSQIAGLRECSGACPSGDANAAFELKVRNGRAYGFVRDDDAGGPAGQDGGQVITGGPLINDGGWHHVTLIRDVEAGLLALYADGLEHAELPLNAGADGPLTDTDGETDPFMIGAQIEDGGLGPVEEITGTIDDVRIFSGARYPDTTPPGFDPVVTGTAGDNGWYRSPVTVAWRILDESIIRGRSGCDTTVLGASGSLTCTATSAGGTASGSIGLRLDTAAPTVACFAKQTLALGAEASISASVGDGGSGVVAGRISAPAATADAGTFTVSLTGRDNAGNSTTVECPYDVTSLSQVPIGRIATLPAAKACISRKRLRIRLRDVKALEIVRAQVKLGTKVRRTVTGRALSLPIDLTRLPKGRVKVTITTTDEAGLRRTGTRTYRTCAAKRSGR